MNDPNAGLVDTAQREALVSLTALYFIEEHALLSGEQLADARQSLQALFLRTSGEETMLRKLIEILKATRRIHQSFAAISATLAGVSRCAETLHGKLAALRDELDRAPLSVEENAAFTGPFLAFSHEFVRRIEALHRSLHTQLAAREDEAKAQDVYRIARSARERLRRRLGGELGSATHGPFEARIRDEVVASFDYSEAEANLTRTRRAARAREAEAHAHLVELKSMSQMAMNPRMRERAESSFAPDTRQYDDIFALYREALHRYPRLDDLKPMVVELFKMYQHTYGMLQLDFDRLQAAAAAMLDDTGAYFEAKEEDQDLTAKREKLHKIEGLIPFLEAAVAPLHDTALERYHRFSRRLSDLISARPQPWEHIAEHLLRAKVQAEAELSTRL